MKGPDALAGVWRGGRSALSGAPTGTAGGAGPGQEMTAAQAMDSNTGAGRHTSPRPNRAVGRPKRLALSNWPVSTRLVAVFIAASVTGLVFGGLRVADAVGAANGFARTTQLAVLGKQITQLEQDLANERDLTVGTVALTTLQNDAPPHNTGTAVTAALRSALATEQGQLEQAQRVTSSTAAPVEQLAQNILSNSAFPESVRDGANSVVAQVSDGGLDAVRLQVLGGQATATGQTPAAIISDYSATLSVLFALNAQVAGSSGDATLSNEVNALDALTQAKDQAAQQRAILDAAFIESGLNNAGGTKAAPAAFNTIGGPEAMNNAGGLQALVTAQDLQNTDLATFQAAATQSELEAYLAGQGGNLVTNAGDIESAVTTDNGNPQAIFPQLNELIGGLNRTTAPSQWYQDQSSVVDEMQATSNDIATQIVSRSQFLQHQSFDSALVTGIATVLVVLLVLGATALIGQTLVSPLRRLTADALEIAAVRLPARVAAAATGTEASEGPPQVEPIGVQSTDEIGRVARAFDQVHSEAVRLAGNEAQLRGSLNAMFISLSRRSVPLIERLSRMIDDMEQNEGDSDQLAKLFSMDHMITRMRRNSENLLVLAGEEPVRKWTESVPLTDISRAAAAEIEQYSRVALAVQPGIMVSGQAAADIVHLLAELIENATLFSPQTTQVRVTVMELNSGGVLIEVRDDGVGVSPLRLADMNWRLDHPPVVDVSISRHMGLYAVSRLAARHGIRVKLRPGTPQGLSALVWLPGNLAKHDQASPAGSHSRPISLDGTNPPAAYPPPAAPARTGVGRHRSGLLVTSGEHPIVPEPTTVPVARPARAWFTAKRPSTDDTRPVEESAARWQSTTQGWAVTGPADMSQASMGQGSMSQGSMSQGSMSQGSMSHADLGQANGPASMAEQAERTQSGLPKRVPKTSAYPGAGTPAFGMPTVPVSREAGVPVLGAPPSGFGPPGGARQGAQSQQQAPARRRSPEAVRNRLTGFQLGSRDAVQTDQATVSRPLAGEENNR
jgi:signal transduction histidine kinase